MDARLTLLQGQRIAPLLQPDLPMLARALLGTRTGQTHASHGVVQGTEVMTLDCGGNGVVNVLWSDWQKIMPYLKDGFFNKQIVPAPSVPYLQPTPFMDMALVDITDRALYYRVLGTLQQLFPNTYPEARE